MTQLLGERIKELRQQFGMSQYDLCKDICSQAYISKMEKGNVYPSADTLLKLADRLSINISYLLDISNTPRHDYLIEVFTQVREAIVKRDYKQVREIIKGKRKNEIFKDSKHQQFLIWHQAICDFYEDKNYMQTIELLDHALSLTSVHKSILSEREIEILISKGNIFTDTKKYDEAVRAFKNAVNHMNNLPNIDNKFVPIRLYYNFSRALRFKRKYEDSLILCNKALNFCNDNNFLYLRGDLFLQKGINYKGLNNIPKALDNFKLAEMAFNLQGNKRHIILAKQKIQELI